MLAQTAGERKEWLQRHASRRPRHHDINPADVVTESSIQELNPSISVASQIPTPFSVPAEFEESQAVFLSWPYYAFDVDGNQLDPITKDFGYRDDNGNYSVQPIAGYEIDTLSSDWPLAPKWAELADAIQQELPVWLILYNASDTAIVKSYMESRATPLKNYRFFIVDGGNAFWTRDFGPIGAYYGDQDSIAFIDPIYYIERAADDSLPDVLATQLGYKNFRTQLKFEGGNFMCDGENVGFTSSMVDTINADRYVQASIKYNTATKKYSVSYPTRTAWSSSKTLDTLKGMFGLTKMNVLQTLLDDGGTGHIDMYTKLFDQQTILSTEYPEVFNNSEFRDYKISRKGLALERAAQTSFGDTFRVYTLPVPTGDNGQYDSTTSDTFGYDPRGYLNGLTINKTFIFPSFSSNGNGNEAELQQVLELYRSYVPGYKLVPIDSRILTPMAGAIHCITMQVPAENPLRIHHAALRGNIDSKARYPLHAHITNRSGIAQARVMWRLKGETAWQSLSMSADSVQYYSAQLEADQSASDRQVEYYIDATANNGKHQTLPITAPEGFFSFRYGTSVGVSDDLRNKNSFGVFPTPSTGRVSIPLDLTHSAMVRFEVCDVQGTVVLCSHASQLPAGLSVPGLSLAKLSAGVYGVRIIVDNNIADVRRLILSR